tara:strand:- start:1361 stop:1525 length:165 start_codon:yes stop_codon:yes gene_type:complete
MWILPESMGETISQEGIRAIEGAEEGSQQNSRGEISVRKQQNNREEKSMRKLQP